MLRALKLEEECVQKSIARAGGTQRRRRGRPLSKLPTFVFGLIPFSGATEAETVLNLSKRPNGRVMDCRGIRSRRERPPRAPLLIPY